MQLTALGNGGGGGGLVYTRNVLVFLFSLTLLTADDILKRNGPTPNIALVIVTVNRASVYESAFFSRALFSFACPQLPRAWN